jgi:hypothetical protein
MGDAPADYKCYVFKNKKADLCLEIGADGLSAEECKMCDSQVFKLDQIGSSSYFNILPKSYNFYKCLTAVSPYGDRTCADVEAKACDWTESQKFSFCEASECSNSYRIYSKKAGKYFDVSRYGEDLIALKGKIKNCPYQWFELCEVPCGVVPV